MNRIGTNDKPRRMTSSLIYAVFLVCMILAVALSLTGNSSQAAGLSAVAPGLGTAASFAVLGGQTVTNTGPSTVGGDLGVSPGTAITGFPPGKVTSPGATHAADAVALQAQNDVTAAYNALASQACNTGLTGKDLGGMTLTEGVYCFTSSAQLTGQLTLDAQGNAAAVWIFQIASGLNTASSASVKVINGGGGCNVFWQVGSSATIGTGNTFVGNILALTSISLATGTNVSGRALARNGAVTMDNNNISLAPCGQASTATATSQTTTSGTATATVQGSTATSMPQATATTANNTPSAASSTGTTTPAVLIPVSGSDRTVAQGLASLQWMLIGLGTLGLGLALLGFTLKRK